MQNRLCDNGRQGHVGEDSYICTPATKQREWGRVRRSAERHAQPATVVGNSQLAGARSPLSAGAGRLVGHIRKIRLSQTIWLTISAPSMSRPYRIPAEPKPSTASPGPMRVLRSCGLSNNDSAPSTEPVAVIRCQNLERGPRKVAVKQARANLYARPVIGVFFFNGGSDGKRQPHDKKHADSGV